MSRGVKIALLLFFSALCGAGLLVPSYVRRQTRSPQARELFTVINWQLTAFRAADFPGAYRHSAAIVRQKFSLSQFEQMVRRDYASMTQAEHVEFGAVSIDKGKAFAQVLLTSTDGSVHGYIYSFTAESDGWKIDGVQSLGTQTGGRLPGLRV